jgi:hypothetical protein
MSIMEMSSPRTWLIAKYWLGRACSGKESIVAFSERLLQFRAGGELVDTATSDVVLGEEFLS